jgi:hypothetical protein
MVAWRLQTISKQFASLWRWGLKVSEKEGSQMSEIPDNIDQRFLAEQQARILGELAQVRSELNQVRGDLAAMQTGQEEISVEVATLAVNLRDIKDMLGIVEHQISIMKLRIERSDNVFDEPKCCASGGGPLYYVGRDVKTSHRGMGIDGSSAKVDF